MFDRPEIGNKAVLVHVHPPGVSNSAELDEFEDLARSAGASIANILSSARARPDPRYYIGSGKLDEVALSAQASGADLVIFNSALSPGQERNLERRLKCRVLDRIGLILDLFAQRASTFEGKLQVELAQLRHLSTRLVRGWTHLERQKGGIGLRGPGEKQLETDRRLVAARIRRITDRLEAVSRRRALSRRARRRARVPVVSLVGYTNAGKSSLFNALTGAGLLVEDRLFATLDPTLRRVRGPGGVEFLLADTVGFISDLPHELVAAFRSTLEETVNASLLMHVIDAADPERRTKIEQVNDVLKEIGAEDVPQIEVFNKVDLLDQAEAGESGVRAAASVESGSCQARVWVSAVSGAGLPELGRVVESILAGADLHLTVRIPFADARLRSLLFREARVLSETANGDSGWELDIEGSRSVIERLRHKHGLDDFVVEATAEP